MSNVKGSGIISKGIMKMIGLKKSTKHGRVETSEVNGDKHKKIKVSLPFAPHLHISIFGTRQGKLTGPTNTLLTSQLMLVKWPL